MSSHPPVHVVFSAGRAFRVYRELPTTVFYGVGWEYPRRPDQHGKRRNIP